MNQIKKILKEELSKRDQLRARVKSLFLEGLADGRVSVHAIKYMGFEYPEVLKDLTEIAIEWGNEGIQRMRSMKPTSEAEAAFIKMFDGMYADVWFEKYPESIFFFKGDPSSREYWFELKNSDYYCSGLRVLSVFSKKYSMGNSDIQYLIKPLVEEAFRLRRVTAARRNLPDWKGWKKLSD